MSKPGTCRTCFVEMKKPYWAPGGGWYCSEECKTTAKAGTSTEMLKVRNRNYRGKKKKDRHYEVPAYKSYMNSAMWRLKREEVLRRAEYSCEMCGVNEQWGLHVHHLTYERFGNEKLEDLRVLCPECHRQAHFSGKRDKLWRGERYRVTGRRGEFRVVDMRRGNREMIRTPLLRFAVGFARGADAYHRSPPT